MSSGRKEDLIRVSENRKNQNGRRENKKNKKQPQHIIKLIIITTFAYYMMC